MCGTNDILQNRDSDYVYNKLIKAVTMASEKGMLSSVLKHKSIVKWMALIMWWWM